MIRSLSVSGYRSVRDLTLELGPLNVVTGPNGCGKSNLYRAVWLLHQAAVGGFARTLAEEGGMPSALWAGERRKGPVRLSLGVQLSDGFSYSLDAGLPEPNDLPAGRGYFALDPLIKSETITYDGATLCERGKSGVNLRDDSGKRVSLPMSLTRSESVFTQLAEPHRYPYLVALRHHLSSWRFYHGFRTDPESPLRQPQVGVFTPTLSHDGRDLAAAFATIFELGDEEEVQSAVRRALGGAALVVAHEESRARFRVQLAVPGLNRGLEPAELSDGTLRFLCLTAALLSPRLPPLLALNEPETSLHPDLLAPLAALIVKASSRAQLWVVTHSQPLAKEIERLSQVEPIRLCLENGATTLAR